MQSSRQLCGRNTGERTVVRANKAVRAGGAVGRGVLAVGTGRARRGLRVQPNTSLVILNPDFISPGFSKTWYDAL